MKKKIILSLIIVLLSLTTGTSFAAISNIDNEEKADTPWYTISGQAISAPTKTGIYIKNGKKVVVD